jgi:hypothetical protein
MKKILNAIFDDFDSDSPLEWALLISGYVVLGLILLGGILSWI